MKRRQARRLNGRFTRNTVENTFGLHVEVCPSCRGFTVWNVGGEPPTICGHCGAALNPAEED